MTTTPTGTIIYLNGTSSGGKTTIARALQETLPAPYLYVSLDDYSRIFPARYVAVQPLDRPVPSLAEEGLAFRSARHGDELTLAITLGSAGRRYMRGFRATIRALATSGNNVIVDDVLYDPAFLGECVAALAGLPLYFVGVFCDSAESARRERERGDRPVGQAAWQAPRIHAGRSTISPSTRRTPRRTSARRRSARSSPPRRSPPLSPGCTPGTARRARHPPRVNSHPPGAARPPRTVYPCLRWSRAGHARRQLPPGPTVRPMSRPRAAGSMRRDVRCQPHITPFAVAR
jgi:chloramphenicol 3-O phosphotransferase